MEMENVVPSDTGRATALATTLSVLVAWFFLAVWMGVHGVLEGASGPPIGLAVALMAPLALFAADGRLRGPLFEGLRRLDLASLIALQTYRIGGVFFLVAWMAGTLPAAFALPAGLGDILVGASAPLVAAAVAARRPGHRALAIGWNLLGLADLVNALFQGVAHSPSTFGFLAGNVTTDAVTHYPLSLIPTFGVPLGLMLHAAALRRLFSPPRH
jgi:hypothetical protein